MLSIQNPFVSDPLCWIQTSSRIAHFKCNKIYCYRAFFIICFAFMFIFIIFRDTEWCDNLLINFPVLVKLLKNKTTFRRLFASQFLNRLHRFLVLLYSYSYSFSCPFLDFIHLIPCFKPNWLSLIAINRFQANSLGSESESQSKTPQRNIATWLNQHDSRFELSIGND